MTRGLPLLSPTQWSLAELEHDRDTAIDLFRQERMQEPLAAYLEAYDRIEDAVERLLTGTTDLTRLDDFAEQLFRQPELVEVFRYLAAPPISIDDLKVLADTTSIAPRSLQQNPDIIARLMQTIRAGLDQRRFPWIVAGRDATEGERRAAVVASSTLIAVQRVATARRNEGKASQEQLVRQTLLTVGFTQLQIIGNTIETLSHAPKPGQFCTEVTLGSRKADFVIGLWDERIMAIECKVSNSSLNSVKRLNNDAAAKAEVWTRDFGTRNIVPVAILSGVYKLHNLQDAQQRGLSLYWAHRLADLTTWIDQTHRDVRA